MKSKSRSMLAVLLLVYRSAVTMLLLWWIGWALSVVMVGFLMIGAVVVWWIVDLFIIPSMTRERNMRP